MFSVRFIVLAVIFILIGILCIAYVVVSKRESAALKREKEEWEEEQRTFAQGLPGAELYFYRLNAVIFDPSYRTVHIRQQQSSQPDISIGYDKIIGVSKNMAAYTLTIKTADPAHPSIIIKAAPGAGWEKTQDPDQIVQALQAIISQNQSSASSDAGEKASSPSTVQNNSHHTNIYAGSYSVYHSDPAPKKPRSKSNTIVAALLILVFSLVVVSATLGSESVSDSSASSTVSRSSRTVSSSTKPKISPIVYDTELTCGNYTAGIDFPAGDYDIVAKSGRGNVSSDNMFSGGINAIMGEKGSGDSYQQKYSNISLPKGTTLRIGGELVVKIHSDEASGEELSGRNQSITETVTLSNGHFTSGKHFEPGTYDITCTSGSGNISSDNMFDGGLNEVMGHQKEGYIQKAYHIELPEGTVLTVDGIEITMTPSK